MGKIIGNTSALGQLLKQELVPDSSTTSFPLDYNVASEQSLLVVLAGVVQEPGDDYVLDSSGSEIVFAVAPTAGFSLYLIYFGREISIPRVPSQQLIRDRFVGDNLETDFALSVSYPLFEQGVLVFVDGVQQEYTNDWTLDNNTFSVSFVVAPAASAVIDVYIHGVQRNDIFVIEDNSISRSKLNLDWVLNSNGDYFPKNNNVRDLGTLSLRPRKIYGIEAEFSGDVLIQGNLQVIGTGTETILNTETLDVADNEITLNSDFTTGTPVANGGIKLLRGNEPPALIDFDETADVWKIGIEGSLDTIPSGTTVSNHISNTSNPHSVTKSQVGLGSVTNDAQLKRSSNDFSSFTEKSVPVGADILLIEDSADSGNKKYIQLSSLPAKTIANNTFLKWRNTADNGDINILKVDVSDNTVLNSVANLKFQIGEVDTWTIDGSGYLKTAPGGAYIGVDTSDGTDNAVLTLQGGGPQNSNQDDRGAYIRLFGNEAAGFNGRLEALTGSAAGDCYIGTKGVGALFFMTNDTIHWQTPFTGHLLPFGTSGTKNIGSPTERVGTLYVDNVDGISEVPTGTILDFAGSSAPTGFLFADGSAISRTTYATLFAVIGTTFGVGDGSTTFNLPDYRGRFSLGKSAAGTGSTLGETGGSLDHTHSLPSHTHGLGTLAVVSGGDHTHTINHDHTAFTSGGSGVLNTNTTGDHTHSTPVWKQSSLGNNTGIPAYNASDPDHFTDSNVGTTTNGDHSHTIASHTHSIDVPAFSGSSGSAGSHTHTLSGTIGSGGVSGDSTMTSGAENPAYIAVNKIIKT